MCIAIYKKPGAEIKKEVLKESFISNPDGCGFAYINTDNQGVRRIKVKKSMDFDLFYRKYSKAVKDNPESPFLIHFRIKTHGKKDISNCHPFRIDRDTVFIHNGIITGVGIDKMKSDTILFRDKVLRGLPSGWLYNDSIKRLIEDFVSTSKLVVMHVSGNIKIYNEEKGHWKDGVWFSNNSYKPAPQYPKTAYPWQSARPSFNRTTHNPHYQIPHRPKTEEIGVPEFYDKNSLIACGFCNAWPMLWEATHYYDQDVSGLDLISLCPKCQAYHGTSAAFRSYEKLSVNSAIDYYNEVDDLDIEDLKPKPFKVWHNPWSDGMVPAEKSIMQDIEDEEEAMESTYQFGKADYDLIPF